MITIARGPHGERVHVDDTESRCDYTCPVCGTLLVPHKGDVRRHHFKHKGDHACVDSWGGTYCDSEWHHAWQERFPLDNREVTLALGSVRHRADVIVGQTVVEFQHSRLAKERYDDRNAFYGDLGYKVAWLFDLRSAFEDGSIVLRPDSQVDSRGLQTAFQWDNPREAFRAYDPSDGSVDLYFQLEDDVDDRPCIVRVVRTTKGGFEEFETLPWLTAEEFLALTGEREGEFPPPDCSPLEPREDYLRFKERFDVCLDAQQERAAQSVDGATLLLAVPGSGKTTTMVARLGYLTLERGIDPRSIVAVTYGKDATEEMRRRFVRQFGNQEIANAITFCTINALCRGIYHEWCDRKPGRRSKRKLIEEGAAKRLLRDIYGKLKNGFVSEDELIDLSTRICWVKNNMLEPSEHPWLDEDIPHFIEMYERYCDRLKNDGMMDFDDQMRFAKYVLEQDQELLERCRQRYRYWCVDEAQDTSRIQHHVIRMLAGPGGSGNVFMVGDEDQSIYGYRGAFPEALLSFTVDYPNARVLKMETNYRSGEEIVSAANKFVSHCKGRIDKRMVSARGTVSSVQIEEVGDRIDQFNAVLRLILEHQGAGGGKLAVLYRNNATAVPLADILIREGVAFTMGGKVNTLLTSPTVMDVKAFMRLAMDPGDEKAFMRVYMKGGDGPVAKRDAEWACKNARRNQASILDAFVDQMSSYRKGWQVRKDLPKAMRLSSLVRGIADLPPLAAIELLLSGGYGDWLDSKGKSAHNVELLKPIAVRETTLASFLHRLDFLGGEHGKTWPDHRVSDAVTLATTHACKGREFDTVVVIDAIDGVFPSERADPLDYGKDRARDWQEERRLFYVAMTRAKDELILLRPADEDTPFVDEVVSRPAVQVTSAYAGLGSQMTVIGESIDDGPHGVGGRVLPVRPNLGVSVPKPKPVRQVSRYDVDTWQIVERRGEAYCRAENEGMKAEITRGPAGKTVDLHVPWTRDAIMDVAEHVEGLAQGCSEFVAHVDVTGAQLGGSVRYDATEGDAVRFVFEDGQPAEALSRLVQSLESLAGMGTLVVLGCKPPDGARGERLVREVDGHLRTILVSAEIYE